MRSPMNKVIKSEKEWKAVLSDLAFQVTRKSATEKPFIKHDFPDFPGQFNCICCDAELFESHAKFDSGSGWPSFSAAKSTQALTNNQDNSHSMNRIEVTCSRCDAHLGHLFPDGPKPTGLRYCINGSALVFQKNSNSF